ncbi:AAA family ATPase [Solibacillus silvestris]
MYLKRLSLYNFRKFAERDDSSAGLTVHLNENLNLIVGENDAGKTAIIDAVRYLLGSLSDDFEKITLEDFYCKTKDEVATSFTIEGVFTNLNEKEAGAFLEWLSFDSNNDYQLRVILKAERKTNENGQEYIEKKILAGEVNCELRLNSQARDLLKTTYLKPLRDANLELKPGFRSRLVNILKAHSAFQSSESSELVQVMEEANLKIESFFDKEYTEGRSLIKDIENVLGDFYDNTEQNKSKAKFSVTKNDLTSILRKLSLNTEEINLGLGNQNLLFIATEMLLLKNFISETDFVGPNITLIEEIEAHLHTQAQIRLIKFLESELEKSNFSSQFILTTHSSDLVSSINPSNIIMLHNNSCYPMSKDYTLLNENDYKFLERFLDATKSNLFYAKGIILVEGESEMLLIPALAELIGLPLHKSGVSLINVHGTSFERYVKLFSRSEMWTRELKLPTLDIPISIITDIDVKPYIYYEKEGFITTFSIKDIAHLQSISKILGINFEDLNDECIGKEYSTLKKLAKDFNFEVNPTDESALIAALKNDISVEYIEKSIFDKRKIFEEKYVVYNCNLKLNTAPEWTLEYSLSLSWLREILYKAIHSLRYKEAFSGKRLEEYETFTKKFTEQSVSSEEIAYEVFKPLNSKLVSKAEVAQEVGVQLLNIMEVNKGNAAELDKIKQLLLHDDYLKYLIQAIQHVSTEGVSNPTEVESIIEEGALF